MKAKRILSLLLTVMITVVLFPMTALAAGAPGLVNGTDVLSENVNSGSAATVYYEGNAYRVIGYDGDGAAASAGTMTLLSSGNNGLSRFDESYTNNYYADSSRSGFTAACDSMSGDVATIRYSGAKADTNEYISAVVVNSSGEITYYGKLAAAQADDPDKDDPTCTVNLAGKISNGDTLYVFNEQANGDKTTDYSSKLKKIEIPSETLNIEITGNSGSAAYSASEQSVSGFTVKYKIGEADWTEAAPEGVSAALKTGTLAEAKGTNADSYPMGLSEASFDINPGSYTLGTVTVTDGVLEITRAALTITAKDQEYVYNGEIQGEGDTVYEDPAEIAEKVIVGTLQGDDYLYSVVIDGQGQEAGEYDIEPYGAAIYRDGKAVTDNYEITYVNGRLKIIAPAASYTVSFSANGGSGTMDEVKDVSGGYELPKCQFRAPEGKTFDCWLVDSSEYAEGDTITVESDITVTAQWKEVPPSHVHSLTLVEAEEATCTEAGNTAYYTCDGCDLWFEDATGLVEITDKSSVIIKAMGHKWGKWIQTKAPTTTEEGEETRTCSRCSETETRSTPKLDVKSYMVTVNAGEHGSAETSAGKAEAGTVVKVTATAENGYELERIIYQTEDGRENDIKEVRKFTMPEADVTVSVTFKKKAVDPPETFTVTFDANGHGAAPAEQNVESGKTASEPSALTVSGYTFGGWFREASCTNIFSFDTVITEDITIYAKWTRKSSGGSSDRDRTPVTMGSWYQDAAGWHYRENGTPVAGAWRFLPFNGLNYWYYFTENGIMQTGWLTWKGNQYYLYPISDGWMGRMLTGWQFIDGKWYNFETAAGSTQGRMYQSERTPDGYYVDTDGVWDGRPANAGR